MKTSRREFLTSRLPLGTGLTALVVRHVSAQVLPSGASLAADEIERRIRREGKAAGLTKNDLPTPALLVDLDAFEKNLRGMAGHARARAKSLRPHAKTHKCAEVARRQVAAGALGVCVATIPEAAVMVRSGLGGVLLTSPIASPYKAELMASLARKDEKLMVALDNSDQVNLYQEAAAKAGITLNVLVDINVGDGRTGVLPGEPALELARKAAEQKNLQLAGLQAYSGRASHMAGFEARREYSLEVMSQAVETLRLLERHGLSAEILSGGSTGTYNIDSELDGVTELQVGSYVFMDLDYRRIGGREGERYEDFNPSLTVLGTVVSVNQPDRVSLDAGIKSFSTDKPFTPEAVTFPEARYGWGGDEFGILRLEDSLPPIRWGDRLEFVVPHCDPTVNLYDRIYACRDERVEEIWSIMDRLKPC